MQKRSFQKEAVIKESVSNDVPDTSILEKEEETYP